MMNKQYLPLHFQRKDFNLEKSDPLSVLQTMNYLFKLVGYDKAREIFAINLADNGMEFSRFHNLERYDVRVYFTNPYRSVDKAACERNHEFIRYIIPKGKTLNNLTQSDVNLMFSHINSYIRESNQNKTPYELVTERFGPELVELIGIKYVNPQDVILKPKLLSKK